MLFCTILSQNKLSSTIISINTLEQSIRNQETKISNLIDFSELMKNVIESKKQISSKEIYKDTDDLLSKLDEIGLKVAKNLDKATQEFTALNDLIVSLEQNISSYQFKASEENSILKKLLYGIRKNLTLIQINEIQENNKINEILVSLENKISLIDQNSKQVFNNYNNLTEIYEKCIQNIAKINTLKNSEGNIFSQLISWVWYILDTFISIIVRIVIIVGIVFIVLGAIGVLFGSRTFDR